MEDNWPDIQQVWVGRAKPDGTKSICIDIFNFKDGEVRVSVWDYDKNECVLEKTIKEKD